uniref:Potassium channel domain-containing protein n=1 Tax=Setaria digitata TaxID=48799 RepID=A0A915Q7B5_9BILA
MATKSTAFPPSRYNQRHTGIRRHGSLTRLYGTRLKSTLSDTKSVRSSRSFNYRQDKYDTNSLPGRRNFGTHRSPYDNFTHKLSLRKNMGISGRIRSNEMPLHSSSPRNTIELKHKLTCSTLSPRHHTNDRPFIYSKGGIPVRYQNDGKTRGAFVELKTYPGGTAGTSSSLHPNVTGHISVPQLRAKARLKEEKEKDISIGSSSSRMTIKNGHLTINSNACNSNHKESDSLTLPQITVNDSVEEEDEANQQMQILQNSEHGTITAIVRERESLETFEKLNAGTSSSQESTQQRSTSVIIEQMTNANKPPSLDSSFLRSVGSERSDEMSLRSLRRTGVAYQREKMPVSVGIITVMLFIAGGAILFAIWEDWNLFDGAYYSFITLSTIGFGDIVPGQSLGEGSQEKLIVCGLYLLFGMALIAMCFKLMQDDVVQKARWLGQKIGILGNQNEPLRLGDMLTSPILHILELQSTISKTRSQAIRESLSETESEVDDDNLAEEDEDDDIVSEEKPDQDQPTLSSGSSKRDDDELRNP